jgi:hypothetical protein
MILDPAGRGDKSEEQNLMQLRAGSIRTVERRKMSVGKCSSIAEFGV